MSFYSPPKFVKIIQNHELNVTELRVPKKFVEKYWKRISNPIVIRLPNGVQQEIFWVKRDGDIWLHNNWKKIGKFLKFGYSVVFKYIGGSCFHLTIFGLDHLEIDYSNIEFKDEVVSDDEIYAKTPIMDLDDDQTNVAGPSQRRTRGTKRDVTNEKFKNKNPNPSFEIKVRESTGAHGYTLRIPKHFSRTYMKGFQGFAWIRVGEGMPWKVYINYSTVTRGWHPFAKEYNLQVGDICKFKMTKSTPLSFTITISRAVEPIRFARCSNLKKERL